MHGRSNAGRLCAGREKCIDTHMHRDLGSDLTLSIIGVIPAVVAPSTTGTALAIVYSVVGTLNVLLTGLPCAGSLGFRGHPMVDPRDLVRAGRMNSCPFERVKTQAVGRGEGRHAVRGQRPRNRGEAGRRRKGETNGRGRRRRRRLVSKEVTGSTPDAVIDRGNGNEETVQVVQTIVSVFPNLVQAIPVHV